MSRQLIILAGGAGTRLRARLGDLPKPMIPVAGRPLLEHQVELAKKHGFTDLIFFVHYRADLIEKHFGDGKKFGVQIRYILEKEPLGTAGAVLAGFEKLTERFVVLYGDTMVNVDLNRIWNAHEKTGAAATLLLHPNDHPLDSDLVEIDANSFVTAFHNRPHAENVWRQNLVNAGLYVLEKSALKKCAGVKPPKADSKILDFGRDIFPALVSVRGKIARLQLTGIYQGHRHAGTLRQNFRAVCRRHCPAQFARHTAARGFSRPRWHFDSRQRLFAQRGRTGAFSGRR